MYLSDRVDCREREPIRTIDEGLVEPVERLILLLCSASSIGATASASPPAVETTPGRNRGLRSLLRKWPGLESMRAVTIRIRWSTWS